METLPIYTDEGIIVEGKYIFHRLFWNSNHALEVLHIASLYFKLMEPGYMVSTKGRCL